MRRFAPLFLLPLLLGLFGAASASGAQPLRRLTILFTNDVHGYVEPCG